MDVHTRSLGMRVNGFKLPRERHCARDADNLNSHGVQHIIQGVVRRLRRSEGVADASKKFPYKTAF